MKTCLVVDDSDIVRKVACSIFEALKFETTEADSGQAALDGCLKDMPDAILLDSHIPPMATIEFLSTLRAMPKGSKPVVIYCATDNDSGDIARMLSSGADDYVLKPFDRETIRTKLVATGLL